MPNFARAEIADQTTDLTLYLTFLKRVSPGHVVTLPLETGETSRKVMRAINAAAAQSRLRLARLNSPSGTVRFRVLAPEKRTINLTDEAKQTRVEKARATREARRHVDAMGLGGLVADPTGHQGDQPLDAAPPVEDALASDDTRGENTMAMAPGEPGQGSETTQIQEPVPTDQAHPGEALGEPLTQDPVTHEFLPPQQQVQEPDASGTPVKRSPKARRGSRAAGSGNGAKTS
jgi:hypothetical protein